MAIYEWELLWKDAVHIWRAIYKEWAELLNTENSEEAYQSFLSDHAGFFFCDTHSRPFCISKLRLGGDYVTDFVVPEDRWSDGWNYTLIEIESPHTPPFTKSGHPSKRLVGALRQIVDWKSWISSNPSIRGLLPDGRSYGARFNIGYTIYIGTRENSAATIDHRNKWSAEHNISIRSFDALTDNFLHRSVHSFYNTSSAQLRMLGEQIRNDLANPFASAYTDSDWKHIVRDPRFRQGAHMVSENVNLFLPMRTYCKSIQAFYDFLESRG